MTAGLVPGTNSTRPAPAYARKPHRQVRERGNHHARTHSPRTA